jgi:hypothetical protein
MPVSVSTPDTSKIVNGKANNATPVVAALNVLAGNSNALKAVVDALLLGRVNESATLTLNYALTGSPTVDGGIAVNRGSLPDVWLKYNESLDRWQFSNNGTDFYSFLTPIEQAQAQNLNVYPMGSAPQFLTTTTIRVFPFTRMLDSTGTTVIEVPSNRTISTGSLGALGLDSGTVASNTWYWPYLIQGDSGVSALLSTNATTPTLPSGYTKFARLPCPVRTMPSSTALMPFVYQGFGTNTLTCLYNAPEYRITSSTSTGANICLDNGAATSNTDVALTLVPVGATQALIAWSARSANSVVKPKLLSQEQVLTAAASTDIQTSAWVLLDTARTYQYKVTANNTHHACLGFILQV